MKQTPQILKGDRIQLRNGWEAEVLDGYKNRPTRLCKVYGYCTEMGSVYSRDILSVYRDGVWTPVNTN